MAAHVHTLVAALLLLLAPLLARAEVVTNTADSGAGSLRAVVAAASAGATITFAAGLSGKTITLTSGEVLLNKNLTLDASALAGGIWINGNHASRIFELTSSATVTITSLTLTNGYAAAGGAILSAGSLTLNRCTIAGNSVTSGGGGGAIYNNLGSLTLNQCTVTGNAANAGGGAGGGIFNLSGGAPVTLNQCTVSGNLAGTGGGIGGFNLGSNNVTFFNSIVAGNSAGSEPDISANTTPVLLGSNLTSGDPLLAPLGNYGGPTPTRPPLVGSPAIDAGDDSATNTFASDQRDRPRRSGPHVDLGAVEVQTRIVTTNADAGPGSLREAVHLVEPGATITFAAPLSGQTILLTGGELLLTNSLSLDASALPGGLTLSGNNSSGLLTVGAGTTVLLAGLTLANGNRYDGGALYTAAGSTTTVSRCTFSGNSSVEGGAIFNLGKLVLSDCTLAANSSSHGGALQCRAPATLVHCTISENTGYDGGGGLWIGDAPVSLNNCIVAGNTAPGGNGQDLDVFIVNGALVYSNANLVPFVYGYQLTTPTLGPAPLTNTPLLAPLGDYGGPTQTMPPLAGSPAIDAGGVTALTTDQRGGPRSRGFAPDLGAIETAPVLEPVAGVSLPGLYYSSVAWGDYDNDGRLDLLVTGETGSGAISQLWRNTGSGFTNVPIAGLPGVSFGSMAWGDYDHDGRLDFLITGHTGSGRISQLWRNTGSGFTNVPIAGLPGVYESSVAWGDYDNDGRLDFLLTGSTGSGYISQLWRNTGSGFTNVPIAGLPGVSFGSVAWGDYDNDGRLDFLITGDAGSGGIAQLWRNTGSGFTNVPIAGLPGVYASSVAWGDYDNDGRLDFLLTGYTGSGLISQLWRNTGSGFTNVPIAGLPGVYDSSVAWGDYDNDGRLDFLLTGTPTIPSPDSHQGISQLWRNLTPVTNTPPSAPTGLAMTTTTNAAMLSWNAAADAQTPAPGLTYNVRAGTTPGGTDLLAAHVSGPTGLRQVPAPGNAQLRLSLPLAGVTSGQTVYWSVQAVDSAFAGGPFATETSVVSLPQLRLAPSDPTNAVISWSPPTWGWVLQESTNLNVRNWSPAASGEANPVRLPTTPPARFYRLSRP